MSIASPDNSIDRVKAAMRMVRQCPITAGCPTTISAASFARLCAHHRRRTEVSEYRWHCDECRGTRPPAELRLADLAKKKRRMIR